MSSKSMLPSRFRCAIDLFQHGFAPASHLQPPELAFDVERIGFQRLQLALHRFPFGAQAIQLHLDTDVPMVQAGISPMRFDGPHEQKGRDAQRQDPADPPQSAGRSADLRNVGTRGSGTAGRRPMYRRRGR